VKPSGDRFITPLMVLSMIFLLAGLHGTARSSSKAGKEGEAGKATQTQKAQTRPSQTQPSQTRPSQAKKTLSGEAGPEKPRVFTDEDLKKYHSDSDRPATRPATAPAPEDPLKPFKDQQERSRWRQEKIARMQQRILDLQGKLKALEQKRLSVVNPYVPRPPEGEEQKGEEKGLSGPELLARTDGEIKQTSQELETAKKDLATFLETTPE